ncbi:hypothetical protein GGR54DRAFT_376970 [Hypoxylon sp. NC1633]|nr:hypothetical protein GGR54DRAFT_376970 [Hypoxylon sp. NC1633]
MLGVILYFSNLRSTYLYLGMYIGSSICTCQASVIIVSNPETGQISHLDVTIVPALVRLLVAAPCCFFCGVFVPFGKIVSESYFLAILRLTNIYVSITS